MVEKVPAGESLLARISRILHSFDEDASELTLPELVARSHLPRATAHRLAAEMLRLRLLERTPSGRYAIGLALWEAGELSPVSLRMRERALPSLLRLYEATGENVHLAILDGREALYVARLAGQTSVPTLSRMGGRLPLHTTGVGKALLAGRDELWLAAYFSIALERETVHSIVDEQRLRADLAAARAQGYATTRQEMTLGNVSIAAPLPAVGGFPPAAVGLVTHLARANEQRLAPLVISAANDISLALQSH